MTGTSFTSRIAVVGIVVGWGAVGPSRLGAQTVVPGRFEVPGYDWGPRAAWRARAAVVSRQRAALIRDGNLRALNANRPFLAAARRASGAPAPAVTGSFLVPVIAIAYADVATPFSAADYQQVLFSTAPHPLGRPQSLKTYYEQVSGNRISISGLVFDPVRVDSNATYYQQNCNGINLPGRTACPDNGQRFGRLLITALDSVSNRAGSDTTWSRFDNDGPDGLPNSGDDDGAVDFITFLQPTRDGACSGPGIWAHRYVLSAWNGGSPYVSKTPRRDIAGQPIPGQFITVEDYTIQSQVGGVTACDTPSPGQPASPEQIMSIGVVSHETGHAFGLPDLYDTSGSTEGIGEWGIMGSGGYTKAYSPVTFDAWSLNELGWVTVDTLASGRTVTTGPRQISDTVFLARTKRNGDFLLIENRQAVQGDTAFFDPSLPTTGVGGGPCRSRCKKLPGLLLWEIDLGKIASSQTSNTVNVGTVQGVALIQADASNDLRRSGGNRGDQGDSYPGLLNNTTLTRAGQPAAVDNLGQYTGFIIDQIEQRPAGAMRFRFVRRDPTVVAASYAPVSVIVNGDRIGRFEDVLLPGISFTINADSAQEVFGGRSRGRFLGWDRGGPRSQTIVSGANPDTIVANYAVDHRVLTVRTGTGAGQVSANVAGDPTVGIFLAEGTPVTLTAAAASRTIFTGWRGDTATSNLTLTLPMARSYDLEVGFLTAVAVPVADATAEILGTTRLDQNQRDFLDQIGNRNGLFDLGDYLALLKRSGQTASPEVLRAVAVRKRGN